ncbi:MAG: hypothetical protein ACM3P0_18000 [Acidobacteriota bacterium]
MNSEFVLDLMKVLVAHKYIPATVLMHEEIRVEYRKLRAEGIKGKDAREILADNYNTSEKNIQSILYGKRKSFNAYEMEDVDATT